MKTKTRLLIHFTVILVLAILTLLLTFRYIHRHYGILALQTHQPASRLVWKHFEMHKANIIQGQFQSQFPNLSSVLIDFQTNNRLNLGQLEFRIKPANHLTWLHTSQHPTKEFIPNQYHSFKFPAISDSQNKSYEFEIEATSGTAGNSVTLNSQSDWIVRHQFTLTEILSPKIGWFAFQRITNLFHQPGFLIHFGIYSLPLLIYISFLVAGRRYQIPLLVLITVIIWDILNAEVYHPILFFAVLIGWLFLNWYYKLESRISAALTLILLLFMVRVLYLRKFSLAEGIAIWICLFLAFTTCQRFYELLFPHSPKVFLTVFTKDLVKFSRQTMQLLYMLIVTEDAEVARILENAVIKKNQQLFTSIGKHFVRTIDKQIWLITKSLVVIYLSVVYGCIAWLLWQIIKYILGYIKFYKDFFPQEQITQFFTHTGVYLIVFYLVILTIFLLSQLKFKFKQRLFVSLLSLYLVFKGGQMIFEATTAVFRRDMYVLTIEPERVTLWDEATVTGRNFKNLPFQGKVIVAGVEHRVLKWSDKEIIFQVEPGKTRSGDVEIIDSNGKKSNPIPIEAYDFFTKEIIR